MGFLKTILIVIYVIVCLVLIIIASMQNSQDDGASSTIMGGSAQDSFYERNKGRTKEGKLKKWTIILGVIFLILSVVLGIVYML